MISDRNNLLTFLCVSDYDDDNFSVLNLFQDYLTHCSWETRKRYLANSADPDQTPQNAASDQGLHSLQIV